MASENSKAITTEEGFKNDSFLMKSMYEEMKELRRSMDFFNNKFESMLKELAETRKELLQTKKEKEMLNNKMEEMSEKVNKLEVQVQVLSNQSRQNNLEIAGLPCTPNENCQMLAYNVVKTILPTMKQEEIEEAHRIGHPKDRNGEDKIYRPILVKLKTNKVRDEVFRKKKLLKNVNTVDLGISKKRERLYINENLCDNTKAILREANSLRKLRGWKYLWTNNGVVLLRKNEEGKVVSIKCKADLALIV